MTFMSCDKMISRITDEISEKTLFEKVIREKLGDVGMRIYGLIDGKRTVGEIMKEADVDEDTIIDALGLMETYGIIRLVKPSNNNNMPG